MKLKELRLPARASLIQGAGNALIKLFSFVFTGIFTRLILPSQYGTYSLYISYLSIFTVILTLEMHGTVLYSALQRFGNTPAVLSSSYSLFVLVFILLSSFLLIFLPLSSLPNELIPLLLLQIFFDTTVTFFLSKYRYVYGYKVYVSVNILISVITYTLSLIFIIVFGRGEMGRMYGMLLAILPFGISFIVKIFKDGRAVYDKGLWRYLFISSLPMTVHHISLALLSGADKVIVEDTLGKIALSKYSLVYSLGVILSFFTNAINSVYSPWVLRKIRAGKHSQIRDVSGKLCLFIGMLTLIFLSLVPEALGILAPAEYNDAIFAVYPIALSVLPMFLTTILVISETFYEKRLISIISSPIAAALNITLNILSLEKFGIMGAALVTLVSYLILFLLHALLIKRYHLPLTVSVKGALLYILLFSVSAALIAFLSVSILARILAIVAIIMLALPSVRPIKKMIFEPIAANEK